MKFISFSTSTYHGLPQKRFLVNIFQFFRHDLPWSENSRSWNIISQNERFSNFNLQILSSNFNLRACFVKLFNFKLSKTCWKSPKLNKRILAHFEKMSLARWFSAFFEKKGVLPRKIWQKRTLSSTRKMKTNKNAESFPTYRILAFEVW